MATDSGCLGTIKTISWNTPNVTVIYDEAPDAPFMVHEDDIVFVIRDSHVERMFSVEMLRFDRVLNITPHEELSKTLQLF